MKYHGKPSVSYRSHFFSSRHPLFFNFFLAVLANASLAEALDQNFEKYAPLTFWYERDTERSKAISRELRRCFLGSKPIDNSSLPELAQLYNDAIVAFSSKRGAEIIAESSDEPVYFYKFTYQGRYSYVYLPESNGTVPFGKSSVVSNSCIKCLYV